MKAFVLYMRDKVVVEDSYEGDRITAKMHKKGRGYVTIDNDIVIYKKMVRVVLHRGDRKDTANGLGDV